MFMNLLNYTKHKFCVVQFCVVQPKYVDSLSIFVVRPNFVSYDFFFN
jgi:hypothetical protein